TRSVASVPNGRTVDAFGLSWCARPAAWQGGDVTDTPQDAVRSPKAWLPLPVVAERLGVRPARVRQMVRDGALLAVLRDGELQVPEELVANDTVLKHLPGVLTLLSDAG